jgi:hypothetical protein
MNWKRNCKLLRRRYREALLVEKTRTLATRDALRLMIIELANALQSEIDVLDAGWSGDDN